MLRSLEKGTILTPESKSLALKTYECNRLDMTSNVDKHRCRMAAKFGVFVDEDHGKLPTLIWLPKFHKRPY